MAIVIGQYAVTGTATSIFAALGFTEFANPGKELCQFLSIQYNEDATADAFLGGSTVAIGPPPVNCGYKFQLVAANLPPARFTLQASLGNAIDLRSLYLIGTANAANLFFITIVS